MARGVVAAGISNGLLKAAAVWVWIVVVLASCGPAEEPEATQTEAPPVADITAAATQANRIEDTSTPEISLLPSSPATPTALPTEPATPSAAPQDVSSPTVPANTPTMTVTWTPTPDIATSSPVPSIAATVPPTDMVPSITPAATVVAAPPPPPGEVVQPPYASSPCSDKYPCNDDVQGWEQRVRVPNGFDDEYFAHVAGNPTSIAFGPDGLLYVATVQGTIFKLGATGEPLPYVGGLNTPTGIAFRPGTSDLYVASRVRNEIVGGEAQVSLVQGGGIRQIIGGLPCCYAGMHAANGIAFGPDGMGYVGVGGRADHGELLDGSLQQDTLHPLEASILRFSPDGATVEVFATGFRNPYDIAWDANGQLYATDNAPDFGPPEELHRVVPGGQHGYPWFDCDVCFKPPPDVQIIPPIYTFVPHASPTGITAYLGSQFPGYYNSLFVTLWSAFPGAQKVVRLGTGGVAATNFAMGFAQPIDVTVGPDGSLFVADFATGIIFRISYTG